MRALMVSAFVLALAGGAQAQETITYSYDVHGRLVGVARSTGANTAYAYDGGNSRTSRTTTGASALATDADALERGRAAADDFGDGLEPRGEPAEAPVAPAREAGEPDDDQ